MRNILVVLAMFVCTSICLGTGGQTITIKQNNDGQDVLGNGTGANGVRPINTKVLPINHTVNITEGADNIGNVDGALMDNSVADMGVVMSGNTVNVFKLNDKCGKFKEKSVISGASSLRKLRTDVNDNHVNIKGGFNIFDVFGGRIKQDGNASDNKVNLDGVTVGGNVYGGNIEGHGNVIHNKVILRKLLNAHDVIGGYTARGDATDNEVEIEKCEKIGGNVHGAFIKQDGNASDNKVTLNSRVYVGKIICGAKIEGLGNVVHSEVILNDLLNAQTAYGGWAACGDAIENEVTMANGLKVKDFSVKGDVIGGYISQNGNANKNKVHLFGVAVGHDVFGAKIEKTGSACDNIVTISNSRSVVTGWVCGAWIGKVLTGKEINNNKVTINAGTINNDVHGAKIIESAGAVINNVVEINGGKIIGDVYGAKIDESKGAVINNVVTINGGELEKNVYGAWIGKVLIGKEISNNKVIIKGGNIKGNVYGVWIDKFEDEKEISNLRENKVGIKQDVQFPKDHCYGAVVKNKGEIMGGNNAVVTVDDDGNEIVPPPTPPAPPRPPPPTPKQSQKAVPKKTKNTPPREQQQRDVDSCDNVVPPTTTSSSKQSAKVVTHKNTAPPPPPSPPTPKQSQKAVSKKTNTPPREQQQRDQQPQPSGYFPPHPQPLAQQPPQNPTLAPTPPPPPPPNFHPTHPQQQQQPQPQHYFAPIPSHPQESQSQGMLYQFQQQPQQQYQQQLAQQPLPQPPHYFAHVPPQQQYQQQPQYQQPSQQQYLPQQQLSPQGISLAANTNQQYPKPLPQQAFASNKSALTEEQVHERVAQLQQVQLSMTQLLNLQTNPSQLEPELPKLELQSLQKIFSTKLKELEQLNLSPIQIQKLLKELKGLSQEQKEQKLQVLVLQKSFPKRLNQLQQLPPAQLQALQGLPQQEQEKKLQEFELQERFPERLEQLKQLSEAQKLELQGLSREEQEQKLQKWEEEKQQSTTPPITEKIKFVDTVVDITGPTQFSPESELCGGCCPDPTVVFRGSTLNTRTKGIVVKGISNFENYNFYLKDIKAGDTILTATSGGYNSANKSACEMDLSRSNIYLQTQGVLNKGDYCTLIKSHKRFKDNGKCNKFDFENEEILIKYYWKVILTDDGQNLTAKLIDKKIRDEGIARSLSEGYGAGVVCVNNGMDYIFSKMEETEEQSSEELSPKEQSSKSLLGEGAKLGAKPGAKPGAKLPGKGEIGVFCGLAANKSSYNTGLHIDMIGTSMMGGVGKVVEVREKELTVGVFAEYGTGNSDIHSGLCPCKKESKCESSYIGGGLLGRYNIYENEFSGTKLYGEAILRAGQASINFDGNEIKNLSGKEIKYEMEAMYGGCAVGGGCKHKVSEKIDLDWSLRYMVGYQDGKGAKQADADGSKAKFESVTSNRIRIGVRGKYVELEKIKPYAGIGCEYELDGKVKGTLRNGVDMLNIPASDFGGVTGIGELGVSGKVWKFGVDISGQGYLGVRKGFGGMLKLKYAFGKDAHGSKASSKASSLASTKPQ